DNKTYDGATSSTGTPTLTLGSLASGDTANFTQSFANKNVGTSKTITPAGSVTDGNSGNNYSVIFANNTTGAITAKNLTISGVTASDKVYDGNTTASLSGGSLVGVVSPDVVTISAGSGTFASKNIGMHAVTVSGYGLGGADAG